MVRPGARGSLRRLRSQLAGRQGAAVAATALSSLGNITLTIALARTLSATEFGGFSVAFATYVFLAGIFQAAVTETQVIAYPDSEPRVVLGILVARSVSIGVLTAPLLIGVGAATGIEHLAWLGPSIPGLLAFSAIRVLDTSVASSRRAVIIDVVWALAVLCAAVPMFLGLPVAADLVWYLWAFTPTGIVAVLVVAAPISWPALLPSRGELEGARFSVEFLIGQGASQLGTYVVAALAGLSVIGAIRSATVLFGPANVVMQALRPLALPSLAQARQEVGEQGLAQRVLAKLLSVAVLLAVPIVLLPDEVGRVALGRAWAGAAPLLPYLGLEVLAKPFTIVGYSGLRVHGRAGRAIRMRLILAPLKLAALALAAWTGGPVIVAAAFGITAVLIGYSWYHAYSRILG